MPGHIGAGFSETISLGQSLRNRTPRGGSLGMWPMANKLVQKRSDRVFHRALMRRSFRPTPLCWIGGAAGVLLSKVS